MESPSIYFTTPYILMKFDKKFMTIDGTVALSDWCGRRLETFPQQRDIKYRQWTTILRLYIVYILPHLSLEDIEDCFKLNLLAYTPKIIEIVHWNSENIIKDFNSVYLPYKVKNLQNFGRKSMISCHTWIRINLQSVVIHLLVQCLREILTN